MNLDKLLAEKAGLEKMSIRLRKLSRNIHFLREGTQENSDRVLIAGSAQVFKDVEREFQEATERALYVVEHRLSEIEETLTAINTLLNGGKQ
jgi:hypothetical protein